jgi:hypothetical protein
MRTPGGNLMRYLHGKGIWAWKEQELPRAIEVAKATGARFMLFKTGQAGTYFERPAQNAVRQISEAGLVPMAWPVVTCRDPEAEADVAIRSIVDGYAGLVFDVQQSATGQRAGAARLGEIMVQTGLPQETMFLSSLPNVAAQPDLPLAEMARFCRGGYMPKAYASFSWNPVYTMDIVAYREFEDWARQRRYSAPIYPVLGFCRDADGETPLTLGEIRSWLAVLAQHRPTFFSVYRASVLPEAAWPLLAEFKTTPAGQQSTDRTGDYATVQPGDTVSELCVRHRCPPQRFWAWNGHLWDARGKRRDPILLERGWVVRVG